MLKLLTIFSLTYIIFLCISIIIGGGCKATYEYNGVRLQGPDDSTNTWDISTAFGADYHPGSFRPSLQAQCFDREVSH